MDAGGYGEGAWDGRRVSRLVGRLSLIGLVFLLLLVVNLVVTGMGLGTMGRMVPQMHACLDLKFHLSTFHLWFEESLEGHHDLSQEAIFSQLDQAEWYARALLEGGRNADGAFPPITSAALQQPLRRVLSALATLRQLAREQLDGAASSAPGGGALDHRFDQLHGQIVDDVNRVKAQVLQDIDSHVTLFGRLGYALTGGIVLLGLNMGLLYLFHERRHWQQVRRLRESEERFRDLYQNAPVAFCTVWCETLRMGRMNRAARRLLALPEEREAVELPAFFPGGEGDGTQPVTLLKQVCAGQRDGELGVFPLHDGAGNQRWVTLRATPIPPGHGEGTALRLAITDVTRRIQMEADLRRSREQLQQLSRHQETVREEERRWISQEIHDQLGSDLAKLKMDLLWLVEDKEGPDAARTAALTESLRLLEGAIGTVRRVTSSLRPVVLDQFGLLAALEWQAGEIGRHAGISCRLHPDAQELALGQEREMSLFRICQEALTNVVRHARAERVEISLRLEPEQVVMTITDDGRGIAPEVWRERGSLGVRGMMARAEQFGGRVELQPQPGGGTTVQVALPRLPGDRLMEE